MYSYAAEPPGAQGGKFYHVRGPPLGDGVHAYTRAHYRIESYLNFVTCGVLLLVAPTAKTPPQARKIALDEEVRAEVTRKGHLEELLEANQVLVYPRIRNPAENLVAESRSCDLDQSYIAWWCGLTRVTIGNRVNIAVFLRPAVLKLTFVLGDASS